jgi:hypothetical protein
LAAAEVAGQSCGRIILAFPMAFLLDAYAYNSHREYLTPGMKFAAAHHHNESLIGNSIGSHSMLIGHFFSSFSVV